MQSNEKPSHHDLKNCVTHCYELVDGIKETIKETIIKREFSKDSDFIKIMNSYLKSLDNNLDILKNGINDFNKKHNGVK